MRIARSLRRPAIVLGGILVIVALLAWLMGAFGHRTPPGAGTPPSQPPLAGTPFPVTMSRRPRYEDAVGTVRAIHETVVASRLLGRVGSLAITRAGQPVHADDVLAELEASDLRAIAEQARAAQTVAATHRDKARLDLARTEQLVQQGAAPGDRRDTDRAALAAAEAELAAAAQQVAAADSAVRFATIRAPIDGIVVDKLVQLGDVVQPGQAICTLYDPTRLQLVAVVREELAGRLQLGQEIDVTLEALGKACRGRVAEIVPTTNAQSRSFEVKITGPCQPGIVTGMFGRVHIPLGDVEELRVPTRAVRSTGQLDFVDVVEGGVARRRYVRLGTRDSETVQVLSGLRVGETVLLGSGG